MQPPPQGLYAIWRVVYNPALMPLVASAQPMLQQDKDLMSSMDNFAGNKGVTVK